MPQPSLTHIYIIQKLHIHNFAYLSLLTQPFNKNNNVPLWESSITKFLVRYFHSLDHWARSILVYFPCKESPHNEIPQDNNNNRTSMLWDGLSWLGCTYHFILLIDSLRASPNLPCQKLVYFDQKLSAILSIFDN